MEDKDSLVKQFINNNSLNRTTVRLQVLQELFEKVKNKDVSSPFIKPLLLSLSQTLYLYHDSRSLCLVRDILNELCSIEKANTVLIDILHSISLSIKCCERSSMAKLSYTGVNWTCVSRQITCSFVETQANFLSCIVLSGNSKLLNKTSRQLWKYWKNNEHFVIKTIKAILEISSPSPSLLPLLNLTAKFCHENGLQKEWSDIQNGVYSFYCKSVFNCRTYIPESLVLCCSDLFKGLNHEQFSSIIHSSSVKCLLRNPDELISAVSCLFLCMNLDCSRYALEYIKAMSGQLHSTNNNTRSSSVVFVTRLVSQCSDTEVCVNLSQVLLDILLGKSPSGKLVTVEHRQNVLSAISCLSQCPLMTQGLHTLSTTVVEGLLLYLKQEAHSGTQVTLINCMCSFCGYFTSDVPKSLLTHLKSVLSGKTISPQLRLAYWYCVHKLCQGENKALIKEFIPIIHQSIDRVKGGSGGAQNTMLEEGVVLSWLLVSRACDDQESIGTSVTKIAPLLDSNLFLAPKFLSSADDETLSSLIKLAQVLLVSPLQGLSISSPQDWVAALVHIALNGNWNLQESALKCLKLSVEISEELSFGVLNILEESIEKSDIQSEKSAKASYRILLSISVLSSDKGKVTFLEKSFLICHHPLLVSLCRNGPWLTIMKSLSLSINILSDILPNLSQSLLDNVSKLSQSCSNGLSTLVHHCGKDIVIQLIGILASILKRDDILRVSATDLDIATTPPNKLYNTQLRQLLLDSLVGNQSTNIKKETKTYSYADQVWDVKMKQQINQKKILQIDERDIHELIKESKLTQKQSETVTQELHLENSIRETVNKLRQLVSDVHDVFTKLLNTGPIVLPYLPTLINPVLTGINSILTRELCVSMWKEISLAVIPDRKTALLFCWTTLRLISPNNVNVPVQWSTNNISTNINELIPLLADGESITADLTWSCALPMIRSILTDKVTAVGDCVTPTLQVFSKACQSHVKLQDFGHDLFPIAGSLELLSTVISSKATSLRNLKAKKLAIDGFRSLINSVKEMNVIPSDISHQLIICLSDCDDLMRQTALRGIETLSDNIINPDSSLVAALLIACNDSNSENSVLAKKLWQKADYSKGSPDLFQPLFFLLTNPPDGYYKLLSSTASALGQWLEDNKDQANTLYEKLSTVYKTKCKPPVPAVDSFGRAMTTDYHDPWEGRVGVAKGLAELLPYQTPDECMKMFQLIVPTALTDINSDVREAMKETALTAITQHGEALSSELMKHFDDCLNSIDDTKQGDVVRQAVVVLMGSLAKHMESTDPKVGIVTELLLANLDTPSQSVQVSIANCLVPLAPFVKSNAEDIITKLLDKLFNSTVYSQRRGAAYGLAGLIKGLGIPSLKQYNITVQLQTAINDKKNYKQREGGLFAFQALCDMLGKLFEPYVVHLLPDLLLCFGDGNQFVREAAQLAAKTIMTHLSAHGVKLVLPSLLTALEQDSWRTKAGSAELLGTMAYCAPKQLSSCLPSIVPRIMEVLTDSHSKVQQAGSQALKQIGSVIKSPEIQQLVPLLLEALGNPSTKAQVCLKALLDTEFEHKVDAPSLALIMPTVKRALELRSADSKKAAAKVIGVLYGVTDVKDLAPYLNDVLPGLKQSLTDPLPEVRSSSAMALGSMVQGVGNDGLKEVWPWLLRTLQSEETPVDRSGAAQGIAQVLKAQGVEQLHQLMPRFVQSAQDPKGSTHSHDGYLMLMIYLPQVFGKDFLPFIDRVLPPILKGLADESEYVRDTALLAGQTIINNYADQSVDLFLPQLEKGLIDNNWRIRCSSVQLLGDLLFCISGQTGKMTTESAEDDNFATEEANQSIVTALGVDKRNKVLAGLYMGRSDVALSVRQNALHVWKLIVTNTAKTLRDILPTLISLLLSCLASDNYDKRQVAAQTLGDLVRKLGERVLPEIFPMLERGLKSNSTQEREGVCIGLSEIICETSREYMQAYASSLLPMIRTALCDKEREVRIGAAKTFDSLHSAVGHHVLEQVITPLLQQLGKAEGEKREIILDGLQQVMTVKSSVVLPMIIPSLTQQPVNVRALSSLSSVAGQALYKHLPRVIPALVTSLQNTTEAEENFESAVGVVLSVNNEPGIGILIEELCKAGRNVKDTKRTAALGLLEALCSRSTADLSDHSAQLLIFAIETLTDTNNDVCERAWLMLEAVVTKMIPSKQLPEYTGFLYKGLKTCQSVLKEKNIDELNGFNLKGITPLLTMLKEGLVSGSQDSKEESARCLILIIHMSSATTLTAGRVVMAIAGPLIRVLGDRYGVNVKVAVLETLVELVRKVGTAARAFIPQLQTSYLKSLIDVNQPVRNQAVIGIIELVELSPRVDPVFNEIHNGIKKNEDPALRNSLLQALSGVLKSAGSRMNDKYKSDIKDTLLQLQNTVHEGNRLMAADSLGVLCTCVTDEQLIELMKCHLVNTSATSDWGMLQAKGTSLCSAIKCVSDRIISCDMTNDVENAIVCLATSDRVPLCLTGLECISSFINNLKVTPQNFLSALNDNLSNVSMDIRRASCEACSHIQDPSDDLLKACIGPLLVGTKDKNSAVKIASEKALVDLLNLTSGDEKMKYCISSILDSATGRRLEECYSRVLCKLSKN